jgi:carbonic anhydrase/acetyltransferase-like protein (isoleucine patch superfamily)
VNVPGPIVLPFRGASPKIDPDAFLAPGAVVIGNTTIASGVGIWFGCVLRGDINVIDVGADTNIQDGTVVHVTSKTHGTFIGARVTIGHSCLIHGCRIGDGAFIGMRATVCDGATVEPGGMVAAGALLTPGKLVKAGEVWSGSPAKYWRPVNETERGYMANLPGRYAELGRVYRKELGLPV